MIRAAIVNANDGLNLRTAPAESADVVTVLAAGATVTATGQATSDGWALIQAGEKSGWARARDRAPTRRADCAGLCA